MSADGKASEAAARAIVESLPVSPGMTAAVGPGPLGDALAGELRRRGLAIAAGSDPVDVAFVTDDATSAALETALSRCRDRGLVVCAVNGPLDRLDLYPEVHSRGLRLMFRTLDEAPAAGDLP